MTPLKGASGMSEDNTNNRFYSEPARQVPIFAEVDVLVVGGGPSGVAAAVGAARAGARTMLVEQSGALGGMWTSGLVITLAGYNSWLMPDRVRCVAGVGGDWVARAEAIGGAQNHDGFALSTDPEKMKLVADQMLQEAGVDFLLHVLATYPIVEDGTVQGCVIETVEGRFAIRAAVTVDCTGNGDVVSRSGTDWIKGETLQPMTMSMRIGNVHPVEEIDHLAPRRIPIGPRGGLLAEPALSEYASVRADVPIDIPAMREARRRGELPVFGGPWFGGLDKDVVWVNTTRIVGDATNIRDLTRAEVQGRHESFALFDYFRSHIDGFSEGRLLQTSPQIGIRETRRLNGNYTLTGDDIRGGVEFEDSIAIGCWPIDIHPVDGDVGSHTMYVPDPFGIPYRTLVPATTDGLLAAGRCISVDREALGSVRVGAPCTATGHAAGVAAALSALGGVRPRDLDVVELQSTLRAQGALVSTDDLVRQPAGVLG
jgi:hypothetical protein